MSWWLSMGPNQRERRTSLAIRVAMVSVAVAFLGITGGTAVATPWPDLPGAIDITGTPSGRAIARLVGSRSAGWDGTLAASELVVWKDATGYTIGPRAAGYASLLTSGERGRSLVVVPTTARQRAPSDPATRATGSGAWTLLASQCFTRLSDSFSWIDHCYGLYRLANDADGIRDWYALHHFASMKANPPWVMNGASIGSAPAGRTAQVWVDWQPRSDLLTAGCRQITLAIALPATGVADTVNQCDRWRVAKSVTAGEFAVSWDRQGTRELRELSMVISVSVPEGGWPVWYVPASVSGSPF